MTINVGWSIHNERLDVNDPLCGRWKEIVFFEPVPLISVLKEERNSARYLKCPSLLDYCKNIYIIRSPYSFTLIPELDERGERYNLHFNVDGVIEDWFYKDISMRFLNFKDDKLVSMCMTICIQYLFLCDENLEMEVMDVPIISSKSLRNLKTIPGIMNIHKWIRPVDFTFEIQDANEPLEFKRGDPLFAVKFITDENVKLKNIEFSEELLNAVSVCLLSKNYIKKLSLKQRYEMAKRFLSKKKWLE